MRHIKEHPITNFLDNRKSMVYWVIDMHNMVNAEIGKKILSYDVVIKKYEEVYKKKIVLNNNIIFNSQNQNLYKEDYKKNYNLINISLIIFIILLIIAFLKTKKII